MPKKKTARSGKRPAFERNLQAKMQMRAAWKLVRAGQAPDVGTALRMIASEVRLAANPAAGLRTAYRAKHGALRKGARGTKAIDPMDLGLEAAYRLGARPVEMSPLELLDQARHERSYGKKSTARARAGRYLDEARQLGPLNLPNPHMMFLWHQFTPGPTALDTWISGLKVRYPASAAQLVQVHAKMDHAQMKMDRGDTRGAGQSLLEAGALLGSVPALHKLPQRKYEAALSLAQQMRAVGNSLMAAAKSNPRYPKSDARSGTRTVIKAVKKPGGYGYTVKNIWSPHSQTVESFGSGHVTFTSAADARTAAQREIHKLGLKVM